MAKELMQNSRTCGEIAKVCLRSWVLNLIVIASGAKQSIFNLAMPSHELLRSARNDGMRTSPRLRGEVRDGAQRRIGVRGLSAIPTLSRTPSPARKMLATSPRKRGEVKRAMPSYGLLRGASSGAHSRDPLARNDRIRSSATDS